MLSQEVLEEKILACLFYGDKAIVYAYDNIDKKYFYNKINGEIYDTIIAIYRDEHRVLNSDSILSDLEKKKNMFIDNYLIKKIKNISESKCGVTSWLQIKSLSETLKGYYKDRQVLLAIEKIQSDKDKYKTPGTLSDVFDVLVNDINKESLKTERSLKKSEIKKEDYIEKIKKRQEQSKLELLGVPFSWHMYDKELSILDRIYLGWRPGQIISMCADSGVGKTYVALYNLVSVCRYLKYNNIKKAVIFYSIEMIEEELLDRVVTIIIVQDQMRRKKEKRIIFKEEYIENPRQYFIDNDIPESTHNWDKFYSLINNAIDEYLSWDLYLETYENPSIDDIENSINKFRIKHSDLDIACIFIDHAGLVDNNLDDDQNIVETSKRLRPLAKKIQSPFVVLYQLLKSKLREDKDYRPTLQALPGRGKPKHDSHIVFGLYRYDNNEDLVNSEDDKGIRNIMEVIPLKSRKKGAKSPLYMFWNDGPGMKFLIDKKQQKEEVEDKVQAARKRKKDANNV